LYLHYLILKTLDVKLLPCSNGRINHTILELEKNAMVKPKKMKIRNTCQSGIEEQRKETTKNVEGCGTK
jgi:hypothetical protein